MEESDPASRPCRFFQSGFCKFGDQCRFSHAGQASGYGGGRGRFGGRGGRGGRFDGHGGFERGGRYEERGGFEGRGWREGRTVEGRGYEGGRGGYERGRGGYEGGRGGYEGGRGGYEGGRGGYEGGRGGYEGGRGGYEGGRGGYEGRGGRGSGRGRVSNYKTVPCRNFDTKEGCTFGSRCRFLHHDLDRGKTYEREWLERNEIAYDEVCSNRNNNCANKLKDSRSLLFTEEGHWECGLCR